MDTSRSYSDLAGRINLRERKVQKVALGDQFEFLEFVDPNALLAEFAELWGDPVGLVDN